MIRVKSNYKTLTNEWFWSRDSNGKIRAYDNDVMAERWAKKHHPDNQFRLINMTGANPLEELE